jgi:hypothetical protein
VRVRRLLLAAIVLLLAGCAASDAPAPAAGARERRYQATATVLQSRDHGPELCLTGMAGWLPACRGLPIPNWRWDQVEGEQAAGSTIWGRYRLVGTYDGASFTVSRADLAPPERQPSHQEQFKDEPKPGCPEPAGGWQVPDPARRSEGYLEPVTRAARAEPDFAGVWLSYLAPMGNKVAEVRPRWGGRLCVTRQQRSYRELLRIQRELQGDVGADLGLRVLGTGIRESANAVTLMVVVLEERAREALDARYGTGAVQATAVLTPAA